MGCTVAELLERTSMHELHEWIVFESMEAEDERRAYEDASKNVEPTEPIEID